MITGLEKGRRQVGGKAWRVEEKAGIEGGKVGGKVGEEGGRGGQKRRVGGREREV